METFRLEFNQEQQHFHHHNKSKSYPEPETHGWTTIDNDCDEVKYWAFESFLDRGKTSWEKQKPTALQMKMEFVAFTKFLSKLQENKLSIIANEKLPK